MNCFYCDRIRSSDPGYDGREAAFDLGSAAPRCGRHWRYLCGRCGKPAHFMATGWDAIVGKFFCDSCAAAIERVEEPFWAWGYYFRYRSPFTDSWSPSLDRLEYEGLHPLQRYHGEHHPAVSRELYLERYPERPMQRPLDHVPDAEEIRRSWNLNADRWDAGYDDDGDRNRRYQSDEPMLQMLGDVKGLVVLDAGCGNGYLSRKLARAGAIVTGVEQSDRFYELAVAREAAEPLGITYHNASIVSMPFFADDMFDKAVANYVLMDLAEYERVLAEVHRVLKRGGVFVVVFSHPCFSCGPANWVRPAPDSPRTEERSGRIVDRYFFPGPYAVQWGCFDPVLSFHRPLQDYWHAFRAAGFVVDDFAEPSITDRGRRELPAVEVEKALRIPFSCIFRLVKP